jgi:hypothetical protein
VDRSSAAGRPHPLGKVAQVGELFLAAAGAGDGDLTGEYLHAGSCCDPWAHRAIFTGALA